MAELDVLRLSFFICICLSYIDSIEICPDGWVRFQGSCYFLHHDPKTFTEAEHYCAQHGSHLVHVNNIFENKFLKDRLTHQNPHTSWWMGLSDEEIEGIFKWTDTDEILDSGAFTDWLPGQPNDDSHAQDCVHFYVTNEFTWNDYQCSSQFPFICEKRPADIENCQCGSSGIVG